MGNETEKRHRLDHWLKLCCVYKQRSDATQACASGHVKLNGQRAKPASEVRIDDKIEISGNHARQLVVLGLPAGNVSKELARTFYRDDTPPPPPRDDSDWLVAAISKAPQRERGAGRPTKRDRRRIEDFGRDEE